MNIYRPSTNQALLIFSNQGKTNVDGHIDHHATLRHRDPRLCAIGALAFYLFSEWQVLTQFQRPDFTPNFKSENAGPYGFRECIRFPHKSLHSTHTMKDEALEFTSGHIYSQTHISRGGLILFALLSGNDYNVPGVANCDPGIALALIQLGYGHELSDAITNHLRVPHVDVDEIDFNFFIIEWRERICHELRTNPHHCFDSCLPEIADIIESTGFPNRRLLEYYVAPITTLLFTINPDPWYQFCEPSLCDIAIFCQRYLHWSPASALERNLLQVVFPSVILRTMHLVSG